ncbi:MAG TPA: hypothetical protein VHT91_38325 [Kofleriaceae bacterium]|jgi:hypothetical protein|nr:hypothetical protein [Kofleriaceae bacterium]
MKMFKATLGLTALLAIGTVTFLSTRPAEAQQAQACFNMVPTINGNMGTMISTWQTMSNRTLAMTFSINALSDCLGFQRPTPGCTVPTGNQVLPGAISALSVISGAGSGYSLLNQTFPAASSTNFLVSLWNQLAFYENEAGSCSI